MKLSEKILYCRRRAMLSQEALAEQVGVSRQAVSKWETGEAAPEIGKLLLLAQAFGVTTDWLLSEEEPVGASPEPEQAPVAQPAPGMQPTPTHTWVDSVPGVLGTLLRRYGWLFGVRLAVAGAVFLAFGIFTGLVSNTFFGGMSSPSYMSGPSSSIQWFDENGNPISGADSLFGAEADLFGMTGVSSMGFGNGGFAQIESTGRSIFGLFSGFVMLIGGVMLVAGIILAIELKKLDRA